MPIDMKDVGQGRKFPEAVNAYDAVAGRYNDTVAGIATDAKLPTQQLPMAPAPAPFRITSSQSGER